MKEYFLKKQVPEQSCEGNYFIDQDGISYNTPYEYLWNGILGACGCGWSEDLAKRAYKVLQLFSFSGDEWNRRNWSVYKKKDFTDLTLAYWLDKEGLTEHGSSIGGSWLSDKGKKIYLSIKECLEIKGSTAEA